MANWVRYPLPPFSEQFPLGEHAKGRCDTPPSKGVSQRYLRDTLWKQGKWVRYPPLRYYLERVLRDMGGGISHWAAKSVLRKEKSPCFFYGFSHLFFLQNKQGLDSQDASMMSPKDPVVLKLLRRSDFYRSSRNYYRQSCYSWEFPCPSFPCFFLGIPCFFSPARNSLFFFERFSLPFQGF